MPKPYNGENEICHVFTLNFALCAVGRASECHAGVMENPFDLKDKLLAKQECQDGTKMNAGNIVTFWQGPFQQEYLQHSMIIEGRNNWIGSNNLNSFKIWGARRSVFMLSSGISLIFCQIPIGCIHNNTRQNCKSLSATVTDKSISTIEKSTEQKTEEQFYSFVKELSAKNELSKTLICTEFRNGNQALSFILTLIWPNEARKAFGEKTEYKSDWLELKYTEYKTDKSLPCLG